jgi:peroxiredoxin
MKRILGILLLVIILCLILFLAAGILKKNVRTARVSERIRKLPDLTLTDINGKPLITSQIGSGPLLITFFHPDCEYCSYEISSLLASEYLIEHLTFLLVSYADSNEVRAFIKQQNIPDSCRIHIIHDPELKLADLFGADIIPANYIYNESLELIKVFKGSVRPETIIKYLYAWN